MQMSAEKGFSTPWSNPLFSYRTIQPHKTGLGVSFPCLLPAVQKLTPAIKMAVMPFALRYPKGRGSSLRSVGGAGHVILLRGSNVWPAPFRFLCAPFGHLQPPHPLSAANGPGAYPAAVLPASIDNSKFIDQTNLTDNPLSIRQAEKNKEISSFVTSKH